jgi:uncharacterized phage protein gp47/JayE
MAGLDPTGFAIKTLDQIRTELEDDFRGAFGPSFDVSPETPAGQFIGIFAAKLAEGWEIAAAVHAAQSRQGAIGTSLDGIGQLTGTSRLPATKSTVTVTASGTDGTVIPVGAVFSVDTTGAKFASLESRTITAGTATIPCASVEYGPVIAAAGTLTVIETPVGGLVSVTNALDAQRGREIETDEAYRIRQVQLLRVQGASTLDSVRADVMDVSGVTACIVFENTMDVVDADGMPPHSIEVLVQGGDDQDIFDAILSTKAAGIETHGTESGTAEDSRGVARAIKFSRAIEKPVYLIVDVAVTPETFAVDGEAQIKQALADYGATLQIGTDVVRAQLFRPILGVSGVYDVMDIKLGYSPAPFATDNLSVSSRELATIDTSNIVLNVTVL